MSEKHPRTRSNNLLRKGREASKVLAGAVAIAAVSVSAANATSMKKPSARTSAEIYPEYIENGQSKSERRDQMLGPERVVHRDMTKLAGRFLRQYRQTGKGQAQMQLLGLDEAGDRVELSGFAPLLDGPEAASYRFSAIMKRRKGKYGRVLMPGSVESLSIEYAKYPNFVSKDFPTRDTYGNISYHFRALKLPDSKYDENGNSEWIVNEGRVTREGAGGQQEMHTESSDDFFFIDEFQNMSARANHALTLQQAGKPFVTMRPGETRR